MEITITVDDEQLERILKTIPEVQECINKPKCIKCGGFVRSTPYNKYSCQQEFGHCGVVMIADAIPKRGARGHYPKVFFNKTQFDRDTGKVNDLRGQIWFPFRTYCYIAGEDVTPEEYFGEEVWNRFVEKFT